MYNERVAKPRKKTPALTTNLADKAPAVAPEPHLTRTGIMNSLIPSVSQCLLSIPGLCKSSMVALTFENLDGTRRTFRALMTIGLRLMLDSGFNPDAIVKEVQIAIGNELKERADKAKENGATQAPASA